MRDSEELYVPLPKGGLKIVIRRPSLVARFVGWLFSLPPIRQAMLEVVEREVSSALAKHLPSTPDERRKEILLVVRRAFLRNELGWPARW